MMTALEQEIIEKINQLDPEARSRVITYIQNIALAPFNADEWWEDIESIQADMQKRIGENQTTGMLDILYELREEIE